MDYMVTNKKREITTINISPETKEMIDAHGRFKETYDEILKRILTEYDKKEEVKPKK